MKPSLMTECLKVAIRSKDNLLIVGPPGVGKTALTIQACQAENADLIISHPVVSDPTDYKGMPWVFRDSEGNPKATFIPFDDLEKLIQAQKRTVFLLDDLGQAPAGVQAPAMQLIHGGRINGHKVSPEVVFFACTNRRQDMAGVSGILEPVKSRFKILHLEADLDDFCRWGLSVDLSFEVIAFNRWKGTALLDFKPTKDMVNSPCPRTWEAVSDILKHQYPAEAELEMVSGSVGEGMAIEFVAFVKMARTLPDPDLICIRPDEVKVPKETSTLFAICGALTQRAGENNFANIVKYANRLPADFSVMLVVDTITRKKELIKTKAFIDWNLKHQNVLV
jgi:MoxR-like ATPase